MHCLNHDRCILRWGVYTKPPQAFDALKKSFRKKFPTKKNMFGRFQYFHRNFKNQNILIHFKIALQKLTWPPCNASDAESQSKFASNIAQFYTFKSLIRESKRKRATNLCNWSVASISAALTTLLAHWISAETLLHSKSPNKYTSSAHFCA